jgi:Fe-S-cluster containining protein
MDKIQETNRIFYQCQRCTNCCRWPGHVKLTEADISAIARLLGLTEWEFIQRHTRLRPDRRGLSLLERADGSCEFLEGKDCLLQAAKPEQCKGFPNTWNFPGWREVCEAIPIEIKSLQSPDATDVRKPAKCEQAHHSAQSAGL